MAPQPATLWLDQLRKIDDGVVDTVLDEVPDGRMSDVSDRFAKALLLENKQRLLAGDDQ